MTRTLPLPTRDSIVGAAFFTAQVALLAATLFALAG
jgi:hypothetical protein